MINSESPTYEDIFVNQGSISSQNLKVVPRRILVTGAQGMVGNAISRTLGHLQVQGPLCDTELYLSSRSWSLDHVEEYSLKSRIILINNSSLESIEQIDLAIHVASPSNITHINSLEQLRDVNIGFLEKIKNLKPKKIVYLSSGEVYKGENPVEGSQFGGFKESIKRDWYPIAKLEAENFLRQIGSQEEVCSHVIRLFHTYGPGVKVNDGRSFADILWGAALHNEITLKSAGDQIRSFLYLSDAVNGILSATFSEESKFQISNLGSDKPISILEFAQIVADATNSKISFAENPGFSHSPNNYLVPNLDNISKLGWEPQVSLEKGIEQTINWIRNSIQLSK